MEGIMLTLKSTRLINQRKEFRSDLYYNGLLDTVIINKNYNNGSKN